MDLPTAVPFKTICDRRSPSGFNRTGFMSVETSMPAAAAWTACARPSSPPPGATQELFDMFWALKGATERPSCRKMRHSAAVSTLLPTDEAVPWTIRAGAGGLSCGLPVTGVVPNSALGFEVRRLVERMEPDHLGNDFNDGHAGVAEAELGHRLGRQIEQRH